MKLKPVRVYKYRGMIERIRGGRSPRYVWLEGYSADGEEGGEEQPWMTRVECRSDAATLGAVALFVDYRKDEP